MTADLTAPISICKTKCSPYPSALIERRYRSTHIARAHFSQSRITFARARSRPDQVSDLTSGRKLPFRSLQPALSHPPVARETLFRYQRPSPESRRSWLKQPLTRLPSLP